VLLERGGFLGFGEEWLPVPFGAFQVAGEDLRLSRAEEELRRMPKLSREELPTQVSVEHLQQLYAEYNVTPYWERAGQTAEPSSARTAATVATVQEIDSQQGTLTLQTASGSTVDLQVSKELLSTLQEGDQVHVTIRQTPAGQQPHKRRSSPEQQR
jgi:hypothetical protein